MMDPVRAVGEALAEYCRDAQEMQALEDLYSSDAVLALPADPEHGGSRETIGLDGIRWNLAQHAMTFIVHTRTVEGPFLHGTDRFALVFEVEATDRLSGKRHSAKSISVYQLDAEQKICREDVFGQV